MENIVIAQEAYILVPIPDENTKIKHLLYRTKYNYLLFQEKTIKILYAYKSISTLLKTVSRLLLGEDYYTCYLYSLRYKYIFRENILL